MNPRPPGPKRKYPGEFLLKITRNPLQFLSDLAHHYGDIAYVSIGNENVFLINHPDLIRDVLVTNNAKFRKSRGTEKIQKLLGQGLLTSGGDLHKQQRRMIQPAFHQQRIAGFAQAMTRHAVRRREAWRDGVDMNIADEMMKLTLAVVAETLLGADVESETNEISAAMNLVMKSIPLMVLPFSELLEKIPLPVIRRIKAGRQRLDTIIYRLIEQRRASRRQHSDLLAMLLNAQDEEDHAVHMTDEQVRDEAMTIFLAGHETTANALIWTWYLLAQHHEVEARFHEELERVLGNRLPEMKDIQALTYTEKVVTESLRLYPPSWVIGRRAVTEYALAKYLVPARSIVLMSQYVMHRNPRYFSNPLQFDPDRWTPEARAALPRFAFFPFGGGRRQCIGEGFAWMELMLLIPTLAQHWKLRLVEGQQVVPQPLVTLRPKNGIKMIAHRR